MVFSDLISYLQQEYQDRKEEYTKQNQQAFDQAATEMHESLDKHLHDYEEQKKQELISHLKKKTSESLVQERIQRDQYQENVVTELIETAIEQVYELLHKNLDTAAAYYRMHLEKYQDLRPIEIIRVDKRFRDLIPEVWPDFQGTVLEQDDIGITFSIDNMRMDISPRSFYAMQRKEIRSFVRAKLFR